jgi:hypothetical protein
LHPSSPKYFATHPPDSCPHTFTNDNFSPLSSVVNNLWIFFFPQRFVGITGIVSVTSQGFSIISSLCTLNNCSYRYTLEFSHPFDEEERRCEVQDEAKDVSYE